MFNTRSAHSTGTHRCSGASTAMFNDVMIAGKSTAAFASQQANRLAQAHLLEQQVRARERAVHHEAPHICVLPSNVTAVHGQPNTPNSFPRFALCQHLVVRNTPRMRAATIMAIAPRTGPSQFHGPPPPVDPEPAVVVAVVLPSARGKAETSRRRVGHERRVARQRWKWLFPFRIHRSRGIRISKTRVNRSCTCYCRLPKKKSVSCFAKCAGNLQRRHILRATMPIVDW